MPKFTANLGFLFSELDFMERIPAAAAAGFKAVEFPPPYAEDRKQQLVDQLGETGLQQVLINVPAEHGGVGGRGLACLPGEEAAFQDSIGLALDYARAFGSRKMHILAGLTPEGTDFDRALETYVKNVRWAADLVGEHGIDACLEPINNKVDGPGYFMHDPHLGWRIVEEANHPHLKLQFDVYHWQVMAGNVAADLKAALPCIGHIQIADNPGRNEPGTGEINYDFMFDWIDACGWDGWIGAEYKPSSGKSTDSLGWMKPFL